MGKAKVAVKGKARRPMPLGELAKHMPRTSKEELAADAKRRGHASAGAAADADFGGVPRRGRPKKGEEAATVVGKTVKHTPAFWDALAKTAAEQGITVHEAMRRALSEWVERAS